MNTQFVTLRRRPFNPFELLMGDGIEGLGSQTDHHTHETELAYFLSIDMPGVKKDDFEIDLTVDHLKVSAVRKRPFAQENQKEIRFERNFILPKNINRDQVKAHYEDGVLTIALAKADEAKVKKVSVSFGEDLSKFLTEEKN